MKYARTFATPDGESHFEEIEVPPEMVQVVQGRPAFASGAAVATTAARMMHIGADWDGSWHATPKRWFLVTLAGEMEITTSDGETRCFGPGGIWLLDDTTGKGHNTRVLGRGDWYGFGVDLAHQPPDGAGDLPRAVVLRLFDEAINQRRFDVLDEVVAADVVLHSALLGEVHGAAAFKEGVLGLLNACPNFHATIEDLIVVGDDTVVTRLTYRGTDTAGFVKGNPPTGKPFEFGAIYIWRLANGKLVELWQEADRMRLLQQLGLLA